MAVREAKLHLAADLACADEPPAPGWGSECDDGDPRVVRIDGPVTADLVAGTTTPSWADVRVPARRYERVDVRLTDGEALGGKSFVAETAYAAGGEEITLRIRLKFQEGVRFPAPEQGLDVAPGDTIMAALDPDVWMEGTSIDECLEDGRLEVVDGVVDVDDEARGRERCPDLERDIRENIKRSGGLRGGKR